MPFFTWKNLFKQYPYLENSKLLTLCGPRNIGKSYDTYRYVKEDRQGFTDKHKVAILRNTDKEAIVARQDFNNRFDGKMKCYGNMIYTTKKKTIKKDGGDYVIDVKDKHVGYLAGITTYTNLKSVEAKDIKTIIYEEFNEDTAIGRNIYPAFINIITTLIRFSDCTIYMLGNKDGFMSDFYVNWNIIPQVQNDKDVIFKISDIGYWVELGNEYFKDLGNQNTIFYKLAMMDNRTKNYLQGGYVQNISSNVVNFKELVNDFKPMFYLAYLEQKYVLGKWNNFYAIISPWNYDNNLQIRTYSIDLISRLLGESTILEDDELKEIIDFVLKNIKAQNIVFDSYDTLQKFKDLTVWLKTLE